MIEHTFNVPLVTDQYTADPSAHVFNGKIYIYPSHDLGNDLSDDGSGDHFWMEDYHVFSMDKPGAPVIDHGEALHIKDVPWAKEQMWAPDANEKNGKYYLYFPAKDHDGIFRIGAAVSDSPTGPFKAEPEAIKGSYSIDPAVFKDDDGKVYMYAGGLWGGQLEKWQTGKFVTGAPRTEPGTDGPQGDEKALTPWVAEMADDMVSFKTAPHHIEILDENGAPLKANDLDRRYFEGPWLHKFNGKYYLSYSTGPTHYLVYAEADNPYGPFVYKGRVLNPVIGWTTHHSIVEYDGQWYLFYHDSTISGGHTQLRGIKYTKLDIAPDGTITTITPYADEVEKLAAAKLMLAKSDINTVTDAFNLTPAQVSAITA